MHASAQAATVWNIRNLLIAAVALLSLLGLAVSGHVLHNASMDRATASDAASVNETADLLLESAGQWARERGATNLALNAANPATDAQVAAISNYRKSADQPFERAIARMAIGILPTGTKSLRPPSVRYGWLRRFAGRPMPKLPSRQRIASRPLYRNGRRRSRR